MSLSNKEIRDLYNQVRDPRQRQRLEQEQRRRELDDVADELRFCKTQREKDLVIRRSGALTPRQYMEISKELEQERDRYRRQIEEALNLEMAKLKRDRYHDIYHQEWPLACFMQGGSLDWFPAFPPQKVVPIRRDAASSADEDMKAVVKRIADEVYVEALKLAKKPKGKTPPGHRRDGFPLRGCD